MKRRPPLRRRRTGGVSFKRVHDTGYEHIPLSTGKFLSNLRCPAPKSSMLAVAHGREVARFDMDVAARGELLHRCTAG
jgi:hypothetical protein